MAHGELEVSRAATRAMWMISRSAGAPGATGKPETVSALVQLLGDVWPVEVRREVLWMLSEIAGSESVRPIASTARTPRFAGRLPAGARTDSGSGIGGRIAGGDEQSPRVLQVSPGPIAPRARSGGVQGIRARSWCPSGRRVFVRCELKPVGTWPPCGPPVHAPRHPQRMIGSRSPRERDTAAANSTSQSGVAGDLVDLEIDED